MIHPEEIIKDEIETEVLNPSKLNVVFKRVCEQTFHKEIELKKCEECPICHSCASHSVKEIRTVKEK